MGERLVREATAVAFFREQLLEAMEHQKVATSAFTECYLVNLLAAFVRGERMPGREPGYDELPLAILYARALESTGTERSQLLRAAADTALFVSGFFSESLPGGESGVRYYVILGGRAYARLEESHERSAPVATGVFGELAERFRELVDVLGEVSEKTMLSTPASVVRLYERWLETGSRRAAVLLAEHGINPVVPDGSGPQ